MERKERKVEAKQFNKPYKNIFNHFLKGLQVVEKTRVSPTDAANLYQLFKHNQEYDLIDALARCGREDECRNDLFAQIPKWRMKSAKFIPSKELEAKREDQRQRKELQYLEDLYGNSDITGLL